ncbi:hypothetical protein NL676_033799 [Syzygium grande]|nr:hypothetical protein NL676_033799 [Syzygium grande]
MNSHTELIGLGGHGRPSPNLLHVEVARPQFGLDPRQQPSSASSMRAMAFGDDWQGKWWPAGQLQEERDGGGGERNALGL